MIDSTLEREIKNSLYGKGDRFAKFEALAMKIEQPLHRAGQYIQTWEVKT